MGWMEVDEPIIPIATIDTTVSSKPCKAYSNIRFENETNRMTRLGESSIYYSGTILGYGATSHVHQGYFQCPEKPAAIKRMSGKHSEIVKVELASWLKIGTTVCSENVNVVQLFEYRPFEGDYYFAMELAKANLDETIFKMKNGKDPLWRQKTIGYLKDAAKGLSWLHKMRTVHRDIKPDNLLVFDVNEREVCKIGDFGISKNLKKTSTGNNSLGKGSSDWMSPEAIKSRKSGKVVDTRRSMDIFSFGLVGHYAMAQGDHPFGYSDAHGKDTEKNILDPNIKPNRLDEGMNSADHLFQWAMMMEPKDRPTISQIIEHPFFWSASKTLEFIRDFAKSVDNKKDELVNNLRNDIDQKYKKYVKLQSKGMENFDWKAKLDGKVVECLFHRMEGKKGMQLKSYDGTSLLNLVGLLRDKDMHHTDLNRELVDLYFGEEFGEDGKYCFSEEIFVSYFIQFFPDFIIFLWVYLVTDEASQKFTFLSSMKRKHKLDCFPRSMPKVGVLKFVDILDRLKISAALQKRKI